MNKKSYLARVRLPRTPADWLEAMMNFIFFLCGMLAYINSLGPAVNETGLE